MLYKTPEEQILDIVKSINPKNPQEYVDSIVRPIMVDRINEWILKCHDCKFHDSIKSCTMGPADASVFVIGEGILQSQYNSDTGSMNEIVYPYIDTPEGNYLFDILRDRVGISEKDIFFANITNCYCHENIKENIVNRPPSTDEIKCCKVFMDALIKAINPRVIIALGNVAMNVYQKGVIDKLHGQWYNINGIPAIATYGLEQLMDIYNASEDEVCYQYEENFVSDLKTAIDFAYT